MPKIRKKTSTRQSRKAEAELPKIVTKKKVRVRKQVVLELARMAGDEGLEAAKRHLRMLRPELDPESVHEVAWRCEDPQGRGGIETGWDPQFGDYADIHVTW